MEPFKNRIDAASVAALAANIPGPWDRERFLVADGRGWAPVLEPLELKARVIRIADALRSCLPADWPAAIGAVLAGISEGPTATEGVSEGFGSWPLLTLVERHGLGHPDVSLDALRRLTPHFSAEFAIRPYLAADPEGTLPLLEAWSRDPNPHVRRLVSEGSRPRLPWGMRLAHRIARPEAMFDVLDRLADDPSEYVRRSVANHLNDVAKDHPDLAFELGARWLHEHPGRGPLVRHALRTHLKAGDPRAHALFGLHAPDVSVELVVRTATVSVGRPLVLEVVLTSQSDRSQRVKLDYAIHHRRANGTLSPKVFSWTTRELGPRERIVIEKRHVVREVTVRRLYPGEQAVDVRVNGVPGEALPWTLLGS